MLITCVECGARVSDLAQECPTCKGSPKPVLCRLCGKDAKQSECECLGEWYDYPYNNLYYYHVKCLAELRFKSFAPPSIVRCPDCNLDITSFWSQLDFRVPSFWSEVDSLNRIRKKPEGGEKKGWCVVPKRQLVCPACGRPRLDEWFMENALKVIVVPAGGIPGYRTSRRLWLPACSVVDFQPIPDCRA